MVEDALRQFGRAPSPGAAALLQAARNFWTPERVERWARRCAWHACVRVYVGVGVRVFQQARAGPLSSASSSTKRAPPRRQPFSGGPCATPHRHPASSPGVTPRRHPAPPRPRSFLEESRGKITDESAAAVRAMIGRLHAKSDVRTAALQTMDILELALPPAELWALAAANAEGAPPLDFHDFLEDDFVDRMREHIAPC